MTTRRISAFTVIGFEARTSNAREMSGAGVIGSFWARTDKPAGAPIAVYLNYASDKAGEYDYLLGVKAGGKKTAPAGMVIRHVAAGNYAVLAAPAPAIPDVIVGLWQRVWLLEESKQIRRSYRTDFEMYHEDRVELYIGIEG